MAEGLILDAVQGHQGWLTPEESAALRQYRAYLQQAQGTEPLPDLMQAMARQPVQGVNVHAQPHKSPAWIQEQTIEPVAFGALGDPVSQLAFLGAPGLLRGMKGLGEAITTPGPRMGGLMTGERGNLGPPPVGPRGEPLPESVVRTPEGQLQRLYHGTNRAYPDFEMSMASRGAGGDLYGKGVYMTENPGIAGTYTKGRIDPTFEEIQRAYQPGAIVEGYGGRDKVLAFEPGEGWNWRVQVQRVDPQGQPVYGERPRWHQTPPDIAPSPNIRPVYADLKRPFDMEQLLGVDEAKGFVDTILEDIGNVKSKRLIDQVASGGQLQGKQLYNILTDVFEKNEVNKRLQRLGYDGITHMGGAVTGGQPHRVYIAFSPEQVYPSFGVDALVPR